MQQWRGNCMAGNRTDKPVTAPSFWFRLSMQSKAFSTCLPLSYSKSIAPRCMHKASTYFVIAGVGVQLAKIFAAPGSFVPCWGMILMRQPSREGHLSGLPSSTKKNQYSQGVSIRLQSVSLWGMLLQKPITINKYCKTGKKINNE